MTFRRCINIWCRAKAIVAAAVVLACTALTGGSQPADAAEDAKQFYLLGLNASMSGFTPPPGTYGTIVKYYYSGDASGAAANSILPGPGGLIDLSLTADIKVDVQMLMEVPSILWVTPRKILGGRFAFGVLAPVGWQDATVDIDALLMLTLPSGQKLMFGDQLRLTDDTVNIGDPILHAMLGWQRGLWHWRWYGLLNVPIGAYNKNNIVNMGLHRWVFDSGVASTRLNPTTGREVSVAGGITFNGENPDTNYRTGTEVHLEFTFMQHLSKAFAIGLVGAHYQQITDDSGSGATLGGFKGRTTMLGANINYNFQLGQTPVSTQLRAYREFNVKNRLKGNVAIFMATIPLGGPRN